jgi:hypothetical protein
MGRPSKFRCLQRLIRLLGWSNLRVDRHVIRETRPRQVIRWYYIGSEDSILLQINENPPWHAAVYAIRYGLCTGCHKFFPYEDIGRLRKEAERLGEFLSFEWFATPMKRREFRVRHPECARYTWSRIRKEGVPYRYRLD